MIAAAAPVLVLPMAYIVMNDRPITIVFIAPTRKRKPLLFCSISSEPMTAAWPEPIPGRNEQRGAEMIAARVDFESSFFGILICFSGLIVCVEGIVLFLSEIIRDEIPNSPVRSGRRGSFIGRLNVRIPRKPASRNTVIDGIGLFSLKMR